MGKWGLIELVQKLERDWYSDFRSFPLEDTDVLIYDEDGEEVIGVDKHELKKELTSLVSYTEDRAAEEVEEENEDLAELFQTWNKDLKGIIEVLY